MATAPPRELDGILEEAGSAYCVGTDEVGKFELQFRQAEEMTELLETEAGLPGNAAAHLRKAWSKCFRLSPDPNDACGEAVKAIEVAAKPVITPNDLRATLGKMCAAMRRESEKWETDSEFDGSVQTVVAMMDMVWKGHLRHGDESAPLEVSQEAAEMTVQAAVLLVSWFRAGPDSYEGSASMRRAVASVTLGRRLAWMVILVLGVGCVVWSVWQLFTDTNRVVLAVVAAVVTLAVARPAVTNLVWAFSVLFWKPHKLAYPFLEWLMSPEVTKNAETSLSPVESSVRELLERAQQEGAPADRDAAAEALKFLPADGQPSVQQVRDAQAALGGSPVVKAWKALEDLDGSAA